MLITKANIEFVKGQGFVNKLTKEIYNCPGFSKISKFGKEDWAETMNQDQLREFSERGLRLDLAIQAYFSNKQLDDLHPDTISLLQSLKPLLDCIESVHAHELFVYNNFEKRLGLNSPVLGFSDAFVTIGAMPDLPLAKGSAEPPAKTPAKILIDWKSKRGPRYNPQALSTYCMQISLYTYMLYASYGIKIDHALIAIGFCDGSPAHLLWLDKASIASFMLAFYSQAEAYFSKNTYWRGRYGRFEKGAS